MPDTPPSGLPPAAPSTGPTPTAGPSEPSPFPAASIPLGSPRPQRGPLLTALAALVVALVAAGIAVAAWLRPVPESHPAQAPEPTYTDQQIADAKAHVCEAYGTVHQAVLVNTHRPNPVPGDEIGALAAAANGRLALYAGGDYLENVRRANPATAETLSSAVQSLANHSREIGISFLADQPEPALDQLRRALDLDVATMDRLCT